MGEMAYMEAEAEAAAQRAADCVEGEDDLDDDDLLNDPDLAAMQAKRLEAMKMRHMQEKMNHAQGHGEYREIVEEEFLKEVCGSEHVVVHFYHVEFIRCKVMDQHLAKIAHDHMECKFLKINADKAPFFVNKIGVQVLPTVVVFKDG